MNELQLNQSFMKLGFKGFQFLFWFFSNNQVD
jgi:hypothetical protein